jgi:hypothetical protein
MELLDMPLENLYVILNEHIDKFDLFFGKIFMVCKTFGYVFCKDNDKSIDLLIPKKPFGPADVIRAIYTESMPFIRFCFRNAVPTEHCMVSHLVVNTNNSEMICLVVDNEWPINESFILKITDTLNKDLFQHLYNQKHYIRYGTLKWDDIFMIILNILRRVDIMTASWFAKNFR